MEAVAIVSVLLVLQVGPLRSALLFDVYVLPWLWFVDVLNRARRRAIESVLLSHRLRGFIITKTKLPTVLARRIAVSVWVCTLLLGAGCRSSFDQLEKRISSTDPKEREPAPSK